MADAHSRKQFPFLPSAYIKLVLWEEDPCAGTWFAPRRDAVCARYPTPVDKCTRERDRVEIERVGGTWSYFADLYQFSRTRCGQTLWGERGIDEHERGRKKLKTETNCRQGYLLVIAHERTKRRTTPHEGQEGYKKKYSTKR